MLNQRHKMNIFVSKVTDAQIVNHALEFHIIIIYSRASRGQIRDTLKNDVMDRRKERVTVVCSSRLCEIMALVT